MQTDDYTSPLGWRVEILSGSTWWLHTSQPIAHRDGIDLQAAVTDAVRHTTDATRVRVILQVDREALYCADHDFYACPYCGTGSTTPGPR